MARSAGKPRLNPLLVGLFFSVIVLVLWTTVRLRNQPPKGPALHHPTNAPAPQAPRTHLEATVIKPPRIPKPVTGSQSTKEAIRGDEVEAIEARNDDFAEGWAYCSLVGNIVELDFTGGIVKDICVGEPFDTPDGERATIVEIQPDLNSLTIQRESDRKLFLIPKGPCEHHTYAQPPDSSALKPQYNPGNGHWYAIVENNETWHEARTSAERLIHEGLRGHLLTLNSTEENEWVQRNLPLREEDQLWMGGLQDPAGPEPDGGWRWITGEPWSYANWHAPIQPDDTVDEDHLSYVWARAGKWNDLNESARVWYIVEFE